MKEDPEALHFGIIISGIFDNDIKGVEIDNSHPYFNQTSPFRAMSQFASEQEIQVCFLRDDGSAAHRERLKKRIADLKLDGIIAMRRLPTHTPMDEIITDFVQSEMPVVTLFGDCEHLDVRAIDLNNIKCGKTVIERFARLGHRQIAVIIPKTSNSWFDDFYEGARLAQNSQIYKKISIHKIRMPLDGDLPDAKKWLFNSENPNRITACLVMASRLMPGLLRYCDSQNYAIPNDLSVILTADQIYLQELKKHFDLMRINFKDLGKMAIRSLRSMCREEQVPRIQLIDLKFQNNGTSGKPPIIRACPRG